jgi:hypothetical protein
MSYKFKSGDTVVRVEDHHVLSSIKKGDVGVVIDCDLNLFLNIRVKFFNGITCFNNPRNLRLIKEEDVSKPE